MRALFSLMVCLAVLLSGCAAGNAKIASRKGYVRFPEKQYASGEKAEIGLKIKGEASYYGPGFHGKQTASGEISTRMTIRVRTRACPSGQSSRWYASITAAA